MGSGIAQVAATAGCAVKIYDTNMGTLEKSKLSLEKIFNRLVEKGRVDTEEKKRIQSNIHYVNSLNDLQDSNLIIEAIVENLDIKKNVFQELELLVSVDCIIASNTSLLPLSVPITMLATPDLLSKL